MIEIYLLTYTQRNAFHDLPGICYGHNYMKRKITKTNVTFVIIMLSQGLSSLMFNVRTCNIINKEI